MYDLILKNANIIDGKSDCIYRNDIAIKDGKIAKIATDLENGKKIIDVCGLTVSPGWIDSHSHSDRMFIKAPDQKEKIEQGITFSITGQCGGSPAPVKNADSTLLTVGDYLSKVKNIEQGSGASLLVGHNSIRKAVMNSEKRAPTKEELAKMQELLEDALKSGAIGMSLGLYYVPGCYADIDEVIALGKTVAKYNGVLTAHLRNENDNLVEAVDEFLEIIRECGCRAVFSHHKAMDKNNWGKVKTTLAMIDEANEKGADIYVDVYPYIASATSMTSRFLPSQFHPPMTTNVLDLLKNDEVCKKAKEWGKAKWGNDLGWVTMIACGGHPEYVGLTINEIADMKGQSDRFDTVFDIMREGNGITNICTFMMCEEDVEYVIKHPRSMICTDAAVRTVEKHAHPRMVGSFPRAIGRYAREKKVIPLIEMIKKITSLPASVYGLTTKGVIEQGYDADLCIFNADTIIDKADFTNAFLANEGLEYVIVDGKIVLKKGKYNGIRAAKIMTK